MFFKRRSLIEKPDQSLGAALLLRRTWPHVVFGLRGRLKNVVFLDSPQGPSIAYQTDFLHVFSEQYIVLDASASHRFFQGVGCFVAGKLPFLFFSAREFLDEILLFVISSRSHELNLKIFVFSSTEAERDLVKQRLDFFAPDILLEPAMKEDFEKQLSDMINSFGLSVVLFV